MIDNRLVGKRISTMRQQMELTQQQLAAMMNVSHQAVSKWESGQALPDIQTMLRLTRFFGVTVEQLTGSAEIETEAAQPDAYTASDANDTIPVETTVPQTEEAETDPAKEENSMTIQQLQQMAPFMSRETVEEIVLGMENGLSAAQIARIAPYISPECVEKLIEKHRPELSWDTLRRIAPHMRREAVDALARSIAAGKENVKPASETINKAINDLGRDLGKAFDDIGKGVGHAMKKAIRFGENMINEVSTAINDIAADVEKKAETPERSERAKALRKKAFERAAQDGRWDWIAAHVEELNSDPELKAAIAASAREQGRNDWICEHMGEYADEASVDAAIEAGNWDWLGDHAWQLEAPVQEKLARAAMEQDQLEWLDKYAPQMKLESCAMELAQAAVAKNARALAAGIALCHLDAEQTEQLAFGACEAGDYETLNLLQELLEEEAQNRLLICLAEKQEWKHVEAYIEDATAETVEKLMDMAVDQGNFEAVDMLDALL